MTRSYTCPPTDRLQELLSGTSAANDQAELIAHLDDCETCQAALEKLAGADPVLLRAAGALQRTEFTEEPSLRRVLDDLEMDSTLSIQYRPQHREAWLKSMLRPVDSLEMLGQLDKYDVTELLGQGGMGLVLKGFEPALKRSVAIKVLAPELASDRVARQRFAREAQAAAAVRHENVITIHAVSESNGLPYLVMEYVAGGSLQDYLDLHGPAPWQVIARLGAEIAAGLAAAHARGLIHRDIKPSNILLMSEPAPVALGHAKISDFGVARVADESRLTRTGIVPGTPMYMAPEQALNEALDERADLFSLGSVLYALCTGHEPFPGTSPMAVLRQVCESTPRPIHEFNQDIPDWLVAIVERLHAKKPAKRFATAAEVEELLRYNLEHPDQPRMVPRARSSEPLLNKRRVLLMGGLVVLLAGGFLFSESRRWTNLLGSTLFRNGQASLVPLKAALTGHGGSVLAVAFAPDGTTVATGSDDRRVRFWDAATGREKDSLPMESAPIVSLAYAHTGRFLVYGSNDNTVHFWEPPGTHQTMPPLKVNGPPRRSAISPDDSTVAVVSNDQDVNLWDLASRTKKTLPGHHGTIWAIAFAPNGKLLAVGDGSGDIRLWDPTTSEARGILTGDPLVMRALAFSPDGLTLASAGTGDKDVKFWDVISRVQTGALNVNGNGVTSMAFSPDGRLLATGFREGVVRLWDVNTQAVLASWDAHKGLVYGVAFSPDGRTLATAGEDRQGKLWDLNRVAPAPH